MSGNDPTNQDPTSATVIESGPSSGPLEPQNTEQSPSAILDDTTTSAAIADIPRLFSDEQDTPVTIHDSFRERGQLRSASTLRSATGKSSEGCEETEDRPATGGTGTSMLSDQQEEVPSPVGVEAPILAQRPQSPTRQHRFQTLKDPEERLIYAREVFYNIFLDPSSAWLKDNMKSLVSNVSGSHSKPLFHLKVNSTKLAIPSAGDIWNASDYDIAEVCDWIERNWPKTPTEENIYTTGHPEGLNVPRGVSISSSFTSIRARSVG